MKIGIIGAGNVASALGNNWITAGHQVLYGVQNPNEQKQRKGNIDVSLIRSIEEVVSDAEVILIATPAMAVTSLVEVLKGSNALAIIDATNNVMQTPIEGYPTAFHFLKEHTGLQTLVKSFNSTGAENMANPVYSDASGNDIKLDMYVAGSNTDAKAIVNKLALDAGFGSCIDFGDDSKVLLLEQLAISWINLAIFQKMGRNIAFKILTR